MNKAEKDSVLNALKAKHGTVFTLTIPVEKGKATIYLREMDRVCYSSVSKLMQKDELTAVESLLKTLYIGGDNVEIITGNFKALRSAANSIMPLLEIEEGELKKN